MIFKSLMNIVKSGAGKKNLHNNKQHKVNINHVRFSSKHQKNVVLRANRNKNSRMSSEA